MRISEKTILNLSFATLLLNLFIGLITTVILILK